MLYLLFAITSGFTVYNYFLAKKDLLNPAVIFPLVFLIAELTCIIEQKNFDITLHYQTVLVVTAGLAAFTLVAFGLDKLFRVKSARKLKPAVIKPIRFHIFWKVCLLVVQVLAIFFFIIYLNRLAAAAGESGSLGASIQLYDKLTKFQTGRFAELNVAYPMIYRICNPIGEAGAYLSCYLLVNNYVAEKKVDWFYLASVGLQAVLIVLNGSRSPLFRIITMILILFYLIKIKNSSKAVKKRFALIALVVLAVTAAAFVLLLFVMRKDVVGENGIMEYLFIYTGAPLVNLDTFITSGKTYDIYQFGQYTLWNLYQYLEKLTGNSWFGTPNIMYFTHSANGIEIGNVYTMFYGPYVDFGWWGIIPVTAVMAFYYMFSYIFITQRRPYKNGEFSFSLFFFAYLYNDLIMSFFSGRFFGTITNPPFLKLAVIVVVVMLVYKHRHYFMERLKAFELYCMRGPLGRAVQRLKQSQR